MRELSHKVVWVFVVLFLVNFGVRAADELVAKQETQPEEGEQKARPAVIVEERADANTVHYLLALKEGRGADLPTSELKMMLRPLTKAELETELKEWMALLKNLIREASKTNLEVARLPVDQLENPEAKKLKEKQLEQRKLELMLVKHTRTVIDALKQKGGEVTEEENYVNAVVVTKDATTSSTDQLEAFAADFGVWFESREGGKVFMKKATGVLILLILFGLLGKIAAVVTRRVMKRQKWGSRMLREFIQKTIGFVIFFIGVIVALSAIGVEVGTLVTAVGAGGVIIGFALQDSIANFASGMMIMIYKPFDVDDFVHIDGVKGKVERMSFVSTTLVTIDNKELVIPNRKAWGNTITNYTGRSVRRIDFFFPISKEESVERVEKLLLDTVNAHELVLHKPEAVFGVNALSDVSMEVFLRPWVKTDDYWPVYWELTKQFKELFEREGIQLPSPQQDLVLHRS